VTLEGIDASSSSLRIASLNSYCCGCSKSRHDYALAGSAMSRTDSPVMSARTDMNQPVTDQVWGWKRVSLVSMPGPGAGFGIGTRKAKTRHCCQRNHSAYYANLGYA
jgi:hypothetical protein